MRKIILIILLIYSLLLIPNIVSAQLNQTFNLTVPGWNCGMAEDIEKNQCCKVNFPSSFIPPDVGPLNTLLHTFDFFTNKIKEILIQPILDLGTSVAKGNITSCYSGVQSTTDPNDPNCKCINPITPSPGYLGAMNDFCQRQSKPEERTKCLNCANGGGVWSGMGCVYTDTKKFIEDTVFKLGIGLAGGFALLCIIYAAFMMQSSQGNPEKLKKAQELITSCIMGLMLIIFSVFILRLIGVNILKIPGFGG